MLALGVPLEQVIATGGATRHPLWLQLRQYFGPSAGPSAYQRSHRFWRGPAGRGGRRGVAHGRGRRGGPARSPAQVLPDPLQVEAYARAYAHYRAIYRPCAAWQLTLRCAEPAARRAGETHFWVVSR